MMRTLMQDVKYAIRVLAKSPGFAAIAILTLALGIGANTAIFSVVDGVLLHPLPFAHPDRLVWAWGNFAKGNQAAVSVPDFQAYRAQNRSFEHFGAFFVLGNQPQNLSISGQGEQVLGTMVTADFFEALGARPLLGRTFATADEQVQMPQAIIVSYRLWREEFGGGRNVIGQKVISDGDPATVVGVMPASFDYPPQTDLWYPAPMANPGMQNHLAHFLRPISLLKIGTTMQEAQADLDNIAHGLAVQYPAWDTSWSLKLQPLQDVIVGPVRSPLLLLLGAVALVLLIACVNVANLLLARNNSRQREIAVRAALGASRSRLIRQLLTENVLLSLLGGALGVLLASWGVAALRGLGSASVPRLDEVHLNGAVLAFTALICVVTALLFGLAPSFQAGKIDLQNALKEGSHASAGAERQRLRSALVVAEVTLSVALLVGSGLLLNSLWRMLRANPGFDANGVLTTRVLLTGASYKEDSRRIQFFRDFFTRVDALPGAAASGGISELPLSGQYNDDFFTTSATPPKNTQDAFDANFRVVAGNYFQAMRIPLLQGRLFSEQDTAKSSPIVIVDEPFVRRYYASQNALGKHLLVSESGYISCEIVGVVGGIRHSSLQTDPQPTMYFPYAQNPRDSMTIVARSDANPAALASGIRGALAAVDPSESVSTFQTMNEIVSGSAAGNRFNAFLLGLFGALALVLAAAGIYGVMAYAVTRRTHEIGIRLALGAQPASVLGMIVRQGMLLVGIGAILGLALAAALTRLMASQLYEVGAMDPATFATAVMLLVAVALVACYIPARRAMKVEPMVALRYE